MNPRCPLIWSGLNYYYYFRLFISWCVLLFYRWTVNVVLFGNGLMLCRNLKILWENGILSYVCTALLWDKNLIQYVVWYIRSNLTSDTSRCVGGVLSSCTTVSTGRDILAAGGQIQLLSSALVTKAPTSGGPRALQQSCPNPVHLQEGGGCDGGEMESKRRILKGVVLQSSVVMCCRGMWGMSQPGMLLCF